MVRVVLSAVAGAGAALMALGLVALIPAAVLFPAWLEGTMTGRTTALGWAGSTLMTAVVVGGLKAGMEWLDGYDLSGRE